MVCLYLKEDNQGDNCWEYSTLVEINLKVLGHDLGRSFLQVSKTN